MNAPRAPTRSGSSRSTSASGCSTTRRRTRSSPTRSCCATCTSGSRRTRDRRARRRHGAVRGEARRRARSTRPSPSRRSHAHDRHDSPPDHPRTRRGTTVERRHRSHPPRPEAEPRTSGRGHRRLRAASMRDAVRAARVRLLRRALGASSPTRHRTCRRRVEGWDDAAVTLLTDAVPQRWPERPGRRSSSSASRWAGCSEGFGLAALVGVPFGLLMGTSRRAWQAVNPVVQLLRPVSPLAWFPIGLVVLKDAPQAAVLRHLHHRAVADRPQHRSRRRVASRPTSATSPGCSGSASSTYVRHVLVPHTMPSIVTGLRISMGIGVDGDRRGRDALGRLRASASSSGTPTTRGNLGNVVAAIILIGVVGVVLDLAARAARAPLLAGGR